MESTKLQIPTRAIMRSSWFPGKAQTQETMMTLYFYIGRTCFGLFQTIYTHSLLMHAFMGKVRRVQKLHWNSETHVLCKVRRSPFVIAQTCILCYR